MNGKDLPGETSEESSVVDFLPYLRKSRELKRRYEIGNNNTLDTIKKANKTLSEIVAKIAEDQNMTIPTLDLDSEDKEFARVKSDLDGMVFELGVSSGIDLIFFNDLYEKFKTFDWDKYLDKEGMEIYRNIFEIFFLLQRISDVCEDLIPPKGDSK